MVTSGILGINFNIKSIGWLVGLKFNCRKKGVAVDYFHSQAVSVSSARLVS